MTRKPIRDYSLSVVVPFFAILTLLIAAAMLAQTSGAGRPSGQANAVLAPAGTSASLTAERPLMPWQVSTERFAVGRSQTKRSGSGPLDSNPPLFLPAVTYGSGGHAAFSVAVGDVNGDGKPDLLVANECASSSNCANGSVGVLLGNGDGTFQPAVAYSSGGASTFSVAVGDVNGDGKPDLLVANHCASSSDCANGSVGVLLGNGDGTFQPAVAYGSGGTYTDSVVVADVNGDGKPDLLVANWFSSFGNPGSGSVSVLLGNGDGTFQPAVAYGSGGYAALSAAVGDVNGDGKPDLLVANWCSSINCENGSLGVMGVLLGNGDGTFQPAVAYGSGGNLANSVAVGDVNGDGKPDLLVANYCGSGNCGYDGSVGVLLGNGDGTFQPAVAYGSGGVYPVSVAVGDVNGDSKSDLVVANYCGSSTCGNGGLGVLGVLLGNGDGTFQTVAPYGSGGHAASSVVVGDVNGDGKPDLLVANECADLQCTTNALVGVLLNNGGLHSPTTTALAANVDPAVPYRTVTYTATVTSQYRGAVTGTVTFQDAGTTIATVSLLNHQAAFGTKYSAIGSHVITATYSGDADSSGSASPALTEYIEYASRTSLTTSGSPSFDGQPVTFTATVTSTHGPIPDGELVTFHEGTTTLSSVPLAGGTAAYTAPLLSAKTHTIKAAYAGDATFEPSTGWVIQVVDKYSTTTALGSSSNPSAYGQTVTFTAAVTPTGPYPLTGKVRFKDGTTGIGTVTLSGGVATLTKSRLVVGTHPITAEYLGDAASAASTSSVLDQVVQ